MSKPKPYTRADFENEVETLLVRVSRERLMSTIDAAALTPAQAEPSVPEDKCPHMRISDATGKCLACRKQMREPAEAEDAKVFVAQEGDEWTHSSSGDYWCVYRNGKGAAVDKNSISFEFWHDSGPNQTEKPIPTPEAHALLKSWGWTVTTKGSQCQPSSSSPPSSSPSGCSSSACSPSGHGSTADGASSTAGTSGATSTPVDAVCATREIPATASPDAGMAERYYRFIENIDDEVSEEVLCCSFAASEIARAREGWEREVEELKETLARRESAGEQIMNSVKPRVGEFVTEAVERVVRERDAARREAEELKQQAEKRLKYIQDAHEMLPVSICFGKTIDVRVKALMDAHAKELATLREAAGQGKDEGMRAVENLKRDHKLVADRHELHAAILELDARVRPLERALRCPGSPSSASAPPSPLPASGAACPAAPPPSPAPPPPSVC